MMDDLIRAAQKLFPAYEVYISNGATHAVFERHIWPVIREIRSILRGSTVVENEQDFKLRLAKHLYEMLEFRFSKDWDDLPEDCREDWLSSAGELIERMSS